MEHLHLSRIARSIRWMVGALSVPMVFSPAVILAALPAHPASLVQAKSAVLSRADVQRLFGGTFTLDNAGPTSRPSAAAAAYLHSSDLPALVGAWVSGYSAEYVGPLSLTRLDVKSTVNVYRSPGVPRKLLVEMSGLALHAGGGMFKMAQTRYSGIGEYAELTTAVMKSSKGTIALPGSHQATLSFAHGRYGVSVQVTAGKPISIPAVVAAAHVIDSRLHGG